MKMNKLYSETSLNTIVKELTRQYVKVISLQKNLIDRLQTENTYLKGRLGEKAIEAEACVAETAELEMNKIMHPDESVTLESLCKDMGLME